MNEKCLVLFLYEASLLKDVEYLYANEEYQIEYYFDERVLEPSFISQLNYFFEKTYRENKELLKVLFNDMSLLKKFIDNNYEILDRKILTKILSKYRGKDKYIELVEAVGKENDKKINELAIKFLILHNEIIDLYYQEPNKYQKVLQ